MKGLYKKKKKNSVQWDKCVDCEGVYWCLDPYDNWQKTFQGIKN